MNCSCFGNFEVKENVQSVIFNSLFVVNQDKAEESGKTIPEGGLVAHPTADPGPS